MSPKQQRGWTMWSAMFVIGVVVFFLFLLFKLLPPYMDDMKVRSALDGLSKESAVASMSKAELVSNLEKRFDIDYVTAIDSHQLKVETQGRSKVLRFSYEVVVPLAYNVSALLEFDHVRPIGAAE